MELAERLVTLLLGDLSFRLKSYDMRSHDIAEPFEGGIEKEGPTPNISSKGQSRGRYKPSLEEEHTPLHLSEEGVTGKEGKAPCGRMKPRSNGEGRHHPDSRKLCAVLV
jgi:hypothetical protein